MDKCSLFFRGKLFAKAKVSKNTGEVYSEKGDVFESIRSFFNTELRSLINSKRTLFKTISGRYFDTNFKTKGL